MHIMSNIYIWYIVYDVQEYELAIVPQLVNVQLSGHDLQAPLSFFLQSPAFCCSHSSEAPVRCIGCFSACGIRDLNCQLCWLAEWLSYASPVHAVKTADYCHELEQSSGAVMSCNVVH